MSWLTGTDTSRDDLLAKRPPLAEAHQQLIDAIWASPVPAPVLELCRLRMAKLLGCVPALAQRYPPPLQAGLTESKIERLSNWPTDPAFTAAERACIGFAELFVMDPHAITDDESESVRLHLGDAGLVAFTTALGVWDNQHRFDNALGAANAKKD